MNLRIFETASDFNRGVAEAIVRQVELQPGAVVALSGGTTPRPVYELLGSGLLAERLGSCEVTWVVGDERFVPPADSASNQLMIAETLFANGIPARHRFLRFRTEGRTPGQAAAEFGREWRELGVGGVHLAVLGVGDDGHTASLFPGVLMPLGEDEAVAVFVPQLDSWRLTLSLAILQSAKKRFILARGSGKQAILRRLAAGEHFPISDVTSGGESWWMLDRAAVPEVAETAPPAGSGRG